jgi:hypothetical protein
MVLKNWTAKVWKELNFSKLASQCLSKYVFTRWKEVQAFFSAFFPTIAHASILRFWPDDPTAGLPEHPILYTTQAGYIREVRSGYPEKNRLMQKFRRKARPERAG